MKKIIILFFVFAPPLLFAQNSTVLWRNNRTGIYQEGGLLTSWPQGGPKLLWSFNGLGEGHTSVAIDNNKIYITGLTGDKGFLYVFDLLGKLLHKKGYGTEWNKSHNGSRSTVTIHQGKLYIYSGTGNLVCLDQNSLELLWQKNIEKDFGGKNIMWGVSESPLIVNEKIILSPGGKINNIVAIDKNNGALVWTCAGDGDLSSYCSPIYISDQKIPQIVTMMASHIVGIDVASGKKLWSYKYENFRKIHPNTPIYHNNMIFCTSGYGKGSIMLRFSNGSQNVEKVWETKDLEPCHGGAVKIGEYIYGSGDHNKYWFCLEWETGTTKYKERGFDVGNVIFADGMLYCYNQKGEMALVSPNPAKFNIVSKFKIQMGDGPHWAHPVIHRGVLYVRHGDALMAYQISKGE